ncbi:MAG: phage shock protein operon transcriptional activator [Pseudomonadales bacterium]
MTQDHERLLGESPAILRILEEVSRAAPLDRPVLVVGERGTGKELIAARLHFLSPRWAGPFVKLNCAALSETLLETELFGHEAGAFTGATRAHQGRFERADGGTLFLDELANTSLRVQEQILRVIEYGEFERVGGQRTLRTRVRLVAATNEDLPTLARAGRFRHDLLDRLAFDVITLPPLRAREEDILLLAEHFAVGMAQTLGRPVFPGFSPRARRALTDWHWPGNVRELKNVVERALYRTDPDALVDAIDVDPFASPWRPGSPRVRDESSDQTLDLRGRVEAFEIALIEQALSAARFNQRRAAETLGLTYDQLRGYLRKYNLPGGARGARPGDSSAADRA